MIRQATEQDIVEIKHLWDSNFDDPMSYIDFVYNRVATPGDTLVYDTGSVIASMVTLLPVNFVYGELVVRTIYIYGAATHRRFQNRGMMTRMMAYAEDLARKQDCHLSILVPGEPYLFDYYRARGYSPDFNCRVVTIKPGMIREDLAADTTLSVNTLNGVDVFRLRQGALANTPHIEWNAEQMSFVMEDCRIYGENTAHYTGAHGESYAIYSAEKSKLFIKECFGSSDDARLVLIKDLIQANGAKSAKIQLPVQSSIFSYEGSVVRYGMAKPLNVDTSIKDLDPYMNLMLD